MFILKSNVYFGKNSLSNLKAIINKHCFRNCAIVVDNSIIQSKSNKYIEYLKQLLNESECKFQDFPVVLKGEPTYNQLDEFMLQFKDLSFDMIIGIGGGSVLDISKAVGILLKNDGKSIEYRGVDKVKNKGVPVILIPTTAGTGTEVTKTASFIDTDTGIKMGINGNYVDCLYAILDPCFLTFCPKSVMLSSGLDVLVHSLEAITNKQSNELSILFGKESFKLMIIHLIKAINEDDDYAKERILLGSYLGGLAMSISGGGIASAISYPLGVKYKVPHGLAGGIFIPDVIRTDCNKSLKCIEIYSDLKDYVTNFRTGYDINDFIKDIDIMYSTLKVPKLKTFNINDDDVNYLVDKVFEQRKANIDLHCSVYDKNDIEKIIKGVL